MCRVSVSNWCACRNKNKSFHSVYSPRMLPFSIIYVEISVRCTWKGRKCHWQRLNNGEMPWKCKVLRGSVKPSLVILKFQLMLSWNINSRHFCVREAFSCHCAFQQQMLAYWLSNHIKWPSTCVPFGHIQIILCLLRNCCPVVYCVTGIYGMKIMDQYHTL